MKKLFIYGVTALAMLTGCNDLLDKSPGYLHEYSGILEQHR